MGCEARPAAQRDMGELVEKSTEGPCLCFVGQPEAAVGQQCRHQQEELNTE